jgi:hypothetical protein
MSLKAMSDADARQLELDAYEARFGKYVEEHGLFNMLSIRVGVQSFPVYWEDDPENSDEVNAKERRWFRRMICCALHHLVAAEQGAQLATTPTGAGRDDG